MTQPEPDNPLRKAIAEASPRQVKELAKYIDTYINDGEFFSVVDIADALEAFGGGA